MVKKHRVKNGIIFLLCTIMVCLLLTSNVEAASWPGLSKSAYCEVIAPKNINVYNSSNFNSRGTSSPFKKYNAYISTGDVLKLYTITQNYVFLSYPSGSTYKEGYIRRGDLFTTNSPYQYYSSSKAKVNTYKTKNGAYYGYVAKGDKVWQLDGSNGWIKVIYSAKSGKRAYKIGWVKSNDYSKVIGKSFDEYYLRALYIATCPEGSNIDKIAFLYKQFNHRAKYDVKHEDRWNQVFSGYPYPKNGEKVVLFGRTMTAEDVGNAFYGSVAACFGVSDRTIFQGGGYAKSGTKYLNNPPYYGDDANDHNAIAYGIQLISRKVTIDIDISKYPLLLSAAKYLLK